MSGTTTPRGKTHVDWVIKHIHEARDGHIQYGMASVWERETQHLSDEFESYEVLSSMSRSMHATWLLSINRYKYPPGAPLFKLPYKSEVNELSANIHEVHNLSMVPRHGTSISVQAPANTSCARIREDTHFATLAFYAK